MPKTTNLSIILPAFIQPETFEQPAKLANQNFLGKSRYDVLQPLRQWLDELEIQNRKLAHLIAKLIPAQCPFERDIVLFGRTIAHIPPMCKLNPLYDQFVGLRFRALCYLVDQCGEDIQSYC
ncbi:Mo-dependent nitrogenase C-terminal domain-containing protein [Nostoc sp. FACHB-280]|uniref:Mo-dependent nitrogenase C-terminal domain-containing protein n=1 Tax=Nostoc sp. FACHB-280 TaxID=2692839 RepID=UPI00168B4EFB|nr:Mo-dependent nitrogenase C-terminal domain-containing protein [Nostoc sp. FACHB-280]MBD2495584.1 Mo-dependent nitrogenase C-terminal domain-containing protein [Nostoc sp. FACHB-280]